MSSIREAAKKDGDSSTPIDGNSLPYISVIIPCRNEVRHIERCLNSVLQNEYPADRLEVFVVDGMSEDGTRKIVNEYSEKHLFIRLLDNPKQLTPCALNIGVLQSKGAVIFRIDAHARIQEDCLIKSVQALERYGADNVGGVMKTIPSGEGLLAEAIVASLSHPFGVGNSYFRTNSKELRWVDTVFGGCYRREVFHGIGLFNEKLARSQDMEFNLRLKKAGGKILLDPEIVSYYYADSDFMIFCRRTSINGLWAVLPFLYSPIMPVAWRHLVPLAFFLVLLASFLLLSLWSMGIWVLAVVGSVYLIANFYACAQIALRNKDARLLFVMPWVFAALHIHYGLGSFWGLVKLLTHKLKIFRLLSF